MYIHNSSCIHSVHTFSILHVLWTIKQESGDIIMLSDLSNSLPESLYKIQCVLKNLVVTFITKITSRHIFCIGNYKSSDICIYQHCIEAHV